MSDEIRVALDIIGLFIVMSFFGMALMCAILERDIKEVKKIVQSIKDHRET